METFDELQFLGSGPGVNDIAACAVNHRWSGRVSKSTSADGAFRYRWAVPSDQTIGQGESCYEA